MAADRCWLTAAQLSTYRGHPFAGDDDPAALLLVRDGRTVGRFGFLPGLLRTGETVHRIVWGSDWRVADDVRGTSAAGALLLRAASMCPDLLGFGPSRDAFPIYVAARFQIVRVPRFIQPLRAGALLRGRLPSPLAAAVGALVDPVLSRIRGNPRLPGGRVPELPVEADGLRPSFGISFPRDPGEISAAVARPWSDETVHFPVEVRDRGTLRAWAVCRVQSRGDRRWGTVLRAEAGQEMWHELFRRAARALAEAGADTLVLCATAPVERTSARAIGCVQRGSLDLVARLTPKLSEALAAQGGLASARLQYGEGDVLFG